jgi:hypothetical protein
MWWWWFFTCIHNYVSIFWFIAKNVKNPKKIPRWISIDNQTCFLTTLFPTHVNAPKARHFELIEHNYLFQMVKILILCLVIVSFKISKLWIFFMIWFFIKFTCWTCIFIEGDMFLLHKKFEINCMTLWIHFDYFFKKCN